MKSDAFVTAIVPVYNAEAYLESCVRSLMNQTHNNIEIILVDDGSCDGSGAICDLLAKEDQRIAVIHRANGGAGAARNAGIDKASGEYLFFCDSDDEYESGFIEKALASMAEHGSELAIAAVNVRAGGIVQSVADCVPYAVNYASVKELAAYMLPCHITCYWWGNIAKLFVTDIIKRNGVRFIEGVPVTEDFTFNISYLKRISKASVIHEGLYNFRADAPDSLSKRNGDSLLRWKLFKKLFGYEKEFYCGLGLYEENKAAVDCKLVSHGVRALFQIVSDESIRGVKAKKTAAGVVASDQTLKSSYYSRVRLSKRYRRIAGYMMKNRLAFAMAYARFIIAGRRLLNNYTKRGGRL